MDTQDRISVAVNRIFHYLDVTKRTDSPVHPSEVQLIKKDIETKLNAGWREFEICMYLRWMESFNTVDSEEKCLAKMKQIGEEVTARIARV